MLKRLCLAIALIFPLISTTVSAQPPPVTYKYYLGKVYVYAGGICCVYQWDQFNGYVLVLTFTY